MNEFIQSIGYLILWLKGKVVLSKMLHCYFLRTDLRTSLNWDHENTPKQTIKIHVAIYVKKIPITFLWFEMKKAFNFAS